MPPNEPRSRRGPPPPSDDDEPEKSGTHRHSTSSIVCRYGSTSVYVGQSLRVPSRPRYIFQGLMIVAAAIIYSQVRRGAVRVPGQGRDAGGYGAHGGGRQRRAP